MSPDLSMSFSLYICTCCAHLRNIHSFPTRRSSDLWKDRGFLARVDHEAGKGVLSLGWTSDFGRDIERPRNNSDRKSTRLNSSHSQSSYAVFCLKKKKCSGAGIDTYVIASISTPV